MRRRALKPSTGKPRTGPPHLAGVAATLCLAIFVLSGQMSPACGRALTSMGDSLEETSRIMAQNRRDEEQRRIAEETRRLRQAVEEQTRRQQEEARLLRQALEEESRGLEEERARSARAAAAEKGPVSGTGWLTDSGYIVTANHIVADADRISIVLTDGQSYNATVAVADKVNDVAVLSVGPEFPRAGGLQLASAAARPAASVLALGYPLPDIMGSTLKVTTGTISAIYGFRNDPRTYQFSAQVQSGNSGGPLLNLQGEVIGVVTAKLNAAEVFAWTGALPEGVSYAVKSAYLQPLLDSLPEVSDGEGDPVATDLSPEDVAERATPFVVMVIGEPLISAGLNWQGTAGDQPQVHLEREKERSADASAAQPVGVSSLLEGTWRSGHKTMEITRVPRDEDRINFTPDIGHFYAVSSGGSHHLENYRFEDTSLAVVIDAGYTFPGRILLRWACQEQNAVTGASEVSENNTVQFQSDALLTWVSNDQIRLQATIPVFVSAPDYSLEFQARAFPDCRIGDLDSTTETRVRYEVWVR